MTSSESESNEEITRLESENLQLAKEVQELAELDDEMETYDGE